MLRPDMRIDFRNSKKKYVVACLLFQETNVNRLSAICPPSEGEGGGKINNQLNLLTLVLRIFRSWNAPLKFFKTSVIKVVLISSFLLDYSVGMAQSPQLIDRKATKKTTQLYRNLRLIAQRGIMFGHEDDQAYGIGWWAEEGRSDVKEVTGSYPAVHGWDLGDLGLTPFNLDTVDFAKMKRWIKATYKRGGINTISWHLDNPKTRGSSWDKTPAVKDILPGGTYHENYLEQLDAVADFLKSCKVGFTRIPVIFRPFHEHNGNWFWWGKGHCTEEEYIALWRFTVDYLKDRKKLHHLIYAFSPDRSRLGLTDGEKSYQYGYPGDNYVDIIGLDNYWDVGHPYNMKPVKEQRQDLVASLQLITRIGREKNKVAALTETGNAMVKESNWFCDRFLPLLNQENEIQIAWLLVWRNRHLGHFYTPYKGHAAEKDFIRFSEHPRIFFEKDLNNIYRADFTPENL